MYIMLVILMDNVNSWTSDIYCNAHELLHDALDFNLSTFSRLEYAREPSLRLSPTLRVAHLSSDSPKDHPINHEYPTSFIHHQYNSCFHDTLSLLVKALHTLGWPR